MNDFALRLSGLTVRHAPRRGTTTALSAVDGLSLDLPRGETVAIVGESGSGKSTTLHALLGLLPARARVRFDTLTVHGDPVDDVRSLRGGALGIVPQDPTTALDPLVRIGEHFREAHRYIAGIRDRQRSRELAVSALASVGVDHPTTRLRQYPHELSGGLRQRVLIALALVGEPTILLADEPTSNLDATVQKRVLDLLDELRAERGLSVLLVTHDIAVATERSSQIVVLRGGRVVENGPTAEVIADPQAAYTRELLSALPGNLPTRTPRPIPVGEEPVLVAEGLHKTFSSGRGRPAITAVDDLSVSLHRGRTVALVGESGAGKSTALRVLTGLEAPDRGSVRIDGRTIDARHRARGVLAPGLQLVYQNPARSLSPQLTVFEAIAEPLEAAGMTSRAERLARAGEMLDAVRLPTELGTRRPAELSGGQLQRVAIARALAPKPRILVLDEPVSALDQSVQFSLLELLLELQLRLDIAIVLVSHDLGVVRAVADEVIVLREGRVVEAGPTEQVLLDPVSPHTRALVDAIPASPMSISPERKNST